MTRTQRFIVKSEKLLTSEHRVIRDRILAAFDFEQIVNVMNHIGRTYYDGPPTVERLRDVATLLLNDELNDPRIEGCHRSGGFEAWKDAGEVSLCFTLHARSYDRETDEVV